MWTITEAAPLVSSLAEWARHEGYLLALYGSTLGGAGRDLDLLAVPWRTGVDPLGFVSLLAERLGGKILERGPGLLAIESVAIEVSGRVVDLQVRPAALCSAPEPR